MKQSSGKGGLLHQVQGEIFKNARTESSSSPGAPFTNMD